MEWEEEEEPVCVDDSTEIIAGSTSESASNKNCRWDETWTETTRCSYLTNGTYPGNLPFTPVV